MVIRKDEEDERRIQRVGPILCGIRAVPDAVEGDGALQEAPKTGGTKEVFNRAKDGRPLRYAGKLTGGRKLRDIDVIRLRRNEEKLSYNQWALIYDVTNAVIWNAMKGYTYKHLNWNHPPFR